MLDFLLSEIQAAEAGGGVYALSKDSWLRR